MIPRTEFFSLSNEDIAEPVTAIGFVVEGHLVKGNAPNIAPTRTHHECAIAYQSKQMNDTVALAKQFAESSASVLVTGESGTGKELFSRLIHNNSGRPKHNYVAVNCAAIPEQLMESEIFGHERGAFTGAVQKRAGYFERADGGTLLLDEISEIPLSLQAKLLRVIEEQEVQPIGSDQPVKIDVRIVATSNRDLRNEVDEGRFRSDLFHRINVLDLAIPPLRERKSDIPLLAMHFVELFRHESKTGIKRVTKAAMQKLCGHVWPGNVRELRNVIHRACVLAADGEITDQSIRVLTGSSSSPADEKASYVGLPLADVERKLILACLQKYRGNKKTAAAELGVTARTLSNKLRLYREKGFLCHEIPT